ncbi:hypothetical protein E0I61_11525 [Flavobacterium ranwuense]|uniref:Uncharacterized protein n=1 Tax=Flavobacterium ranwuense TaxID=2541725 RepID=A0ABY2DV08_9FLAO|nr:hypothetical protein [Flavobacterium ranwuense]TDE28510.1 hypothetical protein E0I61_11525 [Flavobacterium ranwuense]
MKKYFSILFIFIFCRTWSQENKSPEYQQKMFEKANEYLKNSEYSSAAGLFRYVNELNPNNDLGKISLTKSDSLRPISRQRLKESLVGKWKLSRTGSNWGMENTKDTIIVKILIIDENKFCFYEQDLKSSKMKLINCENIQFSKSANERFYSYDFAFSDNQIWSFSVNSKNGELRQMYIGDQNENGIREMVCGNPELIYTKLPK